MDCAVCCNEPNQMNMNVEDSPINYTICKSCYGGARNMMAMIMIDSNSSSISPTNSSKGFANALKWVEDFKEAGEEMKDKVGYLAGFYNAFRDHIYTDIQVKPATGPCIPSHRALLAARSRVFENMMLNFDCIAPPARMHVVEIQELNYEELQAFLEFLYTGSLPSEKMEKHVYSLSMAADKYEVSFLQKFCVQHMLRTLSPDNALHRLKISDTLSSLTLKDATLRFILCNMEDIVFSPVYEDFSLRNPHLAVQITRVSCLKNIKGVFSEELLKLIREGFHLRGFGEEN